MKFRVTVEKMQNNPHIQDFYTATYDAENSVKAQEHALRYCFRNLKWNRCRALVPEKIED